MINIKLYWHVTPSINVDSIKKHGIIKSEDGHFGDGVYCIEYNDTNTLQVILNSELFTDNDFTFEDLNIIKFSHIGTVETHIPTLTNYRDEKWTLMKQSISNDKIIETLSAKKFIHLKT